MSEDTDPLGIVGTSVDEKYRIIELCGEGGYSAVYKAEHLVWNEPVAIKFFTLLEDAKPELREKLLSDFIQEGKLMTQLSSRSAAIVQARDIGKLALDDGDWIPYMVLEWLDGPPLNIVLKREKAAGMPARTLKQTIDLLEPVATALDLAHQSGIAHRDLKPANIIIMGDPRAEGVPVKVLDFGIAKVMADHQQLNVQLQQTGQQITAFTPNYGAPEQFSRNFGATGPWTDVFAMALILLELMQGGKRALGGSSFFELGVKSCDSKTRPSPRSLGLEVSDEIEAVFLRAVALEPKDRFASMGAFWNDLHLIAHDGAAWVRPRQLSISGMRARGNSGMSASDINISARPATPSQRDIDRVLAEGPTEASVEVLISQSDDLVPTVATSENGGKTLSNLAGPAAAATPQNKRALMVAALAGAVVLGVGAVMFLGGNESSAPAAATATPQATPAEQTPVSESASAGGVPERAPSAAASTTASTTAGPEEKPEEKPTAKPTSKQPATGSRPRGKKVTPAPSKDGADPWDPNSFGGRR